MAEGNFISRRHIKDFIRLASKEKIIILEKQEIEYMLIKSELYKEIPVLKNMSISSIRKTTEENLQPFLTEESLHGVLLVISEMLSNCLKHAKDPEYTIRMMADKIWCVVVDRGYGILVHDLGKATLNTGFSTAQESLGGGFTIIQNYADKVYLATNVEGTTVIAEFNKKKEQIQEDMRESLERKE